jgi:ribosome-associated heat shock protein Hsp15
LTENSSPGPTCRRLDQWLWFARFAKSRSRASRLCTAGVITLNGMVVDKAKCLIRVGDVIVIPHGVLLRTIRVKGIGSRRGTSLEAQLLYEEAAAPVSFSQLDAPWKPLLMDD